MELNFDKIFIINMLKYQRGETKVNNFKEALKINYRENIDEIIYRKIFSEMKIFWKKLKEKGEHTEELNQVEERMTYLTSAFLNFEEIAEEISRCNIQQGRLKSRNTVDEYLQKALEKSKIEICNKLKGDRDKRQVIERTEVIQKIFSNFEEYKKQTKQNSISQKEELHTCLTVR